MHKYYWIPILLAVFAGILTFFTRIWLAVATIVGIPFLMHFLLYKNKVEVFYDPCGPDKRILLLDQGQRVLTPVIAEKVSKNWLRIKDKLMKREGTDKFNEDYLFNGNIITFGKLKNDVDTNEIRRIVSEIRDPFHISLWKSGRFKKTMIPAIIGIVFIFIGKSLLPPLVIVGLIPLFATVGLNLYFLHTSGVLKWAVSQKPNEITVLYILGSRNILPRPAEAVGQKWYDYKDLMGWVKTCDTTDYYFAGSRVFISSTEVETTFSLDHALKTKRFAKYGLRGYDDFEKATEMVDNQKNYDFFEGKDEFENVEQVLDSEGYVFIKAVRNQVDKDKSNKDPSKEVNYGEQKRRKARA